MLPIRVKLEDVASKVSVLKNSAKIRNEEFDSPSYVFDNKTVFIVPDKTKMERETDVELRNKLKVKRQDFPQDKWKIRRGKIVKVPAETPTVE